MGNYRFRLSDMMPNAWFYKLRDMNRANRSHTIPSSMDRTRPPRRPAGDAANPNTLPPSTEPPLIPSRASYYFPSDSPIHPKASDTHFPLDPPRRSKHRIRRKPITSSPKLTSSSVSTNCSCVPDSDGNDDSSADQFEFDRSCSCKITSSPTDIIIDVGSELELPPILTKPAKKEEELCKFEQKNSPSRKLAPGIHRLRMRTSSPRLASRRVRVVQRDSRRKGLAESFAVVKSSLDPKKDFRESMMEMIVENDLRASKDLEDLLACYLSLNSNEYHDLIVKVFKEIWFDITENIRS